MADYTEEKPKSASMAGTGLDTQEVTMHVVQPAGSAAGSGETTRRNSGNSKDKTTDTEIQVGQDGVDVERAKQDFEQVRRTLTEKSLHRSVSRKSTKGEAQFDPEKGGDHGEEFDLLDFLVRVKLLHLSFKVRVRCEIKTVSELLLYSY